jgi:hypothetical protein
MVVSELCSNGDLFDYIRNVPAPKLSKVVRPSVRLAVPGADVCCRSGSC